MGTYHQEDSVGMEGAVGNAAVMAVEDSRQQVGKYLFRVDLRVALLHADSLKQVTPRQSLNDDVAIVGFFIDLLDGYNLGTVFELL